MGILSVDINNINFDVNFDGDYPETIIHVRLRLGVIDLNNIKQLKKVKQKLMSVAWYPSR